MITSASQGWDCQIQKRKSSHTGRGRKVVIPLCTATSRMSSKTAWYDVAKHGNDRK